MSERARSLALTLISPPDQLRARHAEDEATMESLRSFDPSTPAEDEPTGPGIPPLQWTGLRTPPAAPVIGQSRGVPTWITVLDDPRELPGGPLTGFEVGVKDLMAVEGCTVSAGTQAHQAARTREDAAAVRALRKAGATIRGTTNLHALAYGATGRSSDWGMPVNPAMPGAIPGGSSSGSAVAVAEGSAALTLGTDTSGSIRIPAALCGVVGLKPTRGLVSLEGCHPLSAKLDHIGPLAPSVDITATATAALVGWGPWQLPEEPVGRIRVGILAGHLDSGVDAPVRHAMDEVLGRIQEAKIELGAADLPLARHIPGAQLAILGADALKSNLGTLRERGDRLPMDVLLRLEAGLSRTEEQYEAASVLRARWRAQVDAALRHHHVLISPTTAITAPPSDVSEVIIDGTSVTVQYSLTRLTMPFNLSGHPAITIPFRDRSGTLVGVQLVGRAGGDQELLAVAAYIEELLG